MKLAREYPSSKLRGKKVLVVGLGRSGAAAARAAANLGATVTVTDSKSAAALADLAALLPAGVARQLGGHVRQSFLDAELIVLSPGVPLLPEIAAAEAAGVPMVGELELGARLVEAPIAAVTGTNGKSTTTTLLGAMVAATGRPTFVGGNLGVPLCEAVGSPAARAGGALVLEVSSFQLERTPTFAPAVAVLLNVTPDHLDRYPDFAAYVAAKAQILAHQRAQDAAVLNADDEVVRTLGEKLRARPFWFSTRRQPSGGAAGKAPATEPPLAAFCEGETLCVSLDGRTIERYAAAGGALVGRHNRENALAAVLAARLYGAPARAVAEGLAGFRPLAHRMALVADVDGVRYYDDSKATNVGAAVAALDGFPAPVVLIAGGRDKGGSYVPLASVLQTVGRAVVLIGEAAERIHAALGQAAPVSRAGSMAEAVALARGLARPGDAVVLSPACSSFDMFRDYAHRGEVFSEAVRAQAGTADSSPAGGGK